MKAAQINDYGQPLSINDTPRPKPAEGQVLVEVMAASVNPFDYKLKEGTYQEFIKLNFPATLGGDVSGKIVELGDSVNDFKVGQTVYGHAGAASGHGSFAEYAPVKANQLAAKPATIEYITAAALPLASVSAYQALVDHMGLKPNQKILIHGGAGGIGSLAIQIAKQIGAYVATTVSSKDIDYVKQLGADQVIDYQASDFTTMLSDYDCVFDAVGGNVTNQSLKVLKAGGTLVSMVSQADEQAVSQNKINFVYQNTKVTPERLAKVSQMVEAGKLTVNIDKVFPFQEANAALEYLYNGHPRGKVVIRIK